MLRAVFVGFFGATLVLISSRAAFADQVITLDGEVPDSEPEHVMVPFDVPAGTVEIEVDHDDMSSDNILDWGLYDPDGAFRGFGGGNAEPAIVGVDRTSRSYLTGPIKAGTWNVHVGKAKIKVAPAEYHLVITVRDVGTLASQPERMPYSPATALERKARWYAGDFHVHSKESGDADPSIDVIAEFARTQKLDFVELSDHNTMSQLDFIVDAQSRYPDLLFVPGVEWTTYHGHGNGIGALQWVDHRTGFQGWTGEAAAKAFVDQGVIFGINHPTIELGDLCTGCGWHQDISPNLIGTVEVVNGSAIPLAPQSIEFWDAMCDDGWHGAPLGGSDDHSAGIDEDPFSNPIGTPTTMVFAEELSVAAIIDGIRKGRTVVRWSPDAPMIDLSTSETATDGIIEAASVKLTATVTGGVGTTVRFVRDGVVVPETETEVTSDPFDAHATAAPPVGKEERWRVEVRDGKIFRALTNHVWIKSTAAPTGAGGAGAASPLLDAEGGGCRCSFPSRGGAASWTVVAMALVVARARRRRRGVATLPSSRRTIR